MQGVTTYLDLRVGGDAVTLRVEPDDAAKGALARGGGVALSHLDLEPAPPIRSKLGQLARAFVEHAANGSALDALGRAVRETFPHATLHSKRRIDVEQRTPRWPLRMRSGAPDPSRGRLWPFDGETTAMRLGLRRLVLREWLDEEDAKADARWLEENGLVVERAHDRPESGSIALFAARDRATITDAREAHRAACTPDAGWTRGAQWMGDALGYPPCCVQAFARARMRGDVAMFADLLAPAGDPPSSPLVGWLVGATTLVSHAPCSSSCGATKAIASATLAEIDRRHAGFAALWERLARRVHALDARGRCFVLAVDGDLASTARVTDAIELVPPSAGDRSMERVIVEDASMRQGVVSLDDLQLVVQVNGVERLRAGLFCDQRG